MNEVHALRRLAAILLAIAPIVAATLAAPASAGTDPYRIDDAVVAGGGATLEGGTFHMSGTVGMPATRMLVGTRFRLYDGFWSPAAPAGDRIFANGFDP